MHTQQFNSSEFLSNEQQGWNWVWEISRQPLYKTTPAQNLSERNPAPFGYVGRMCRRALKSNQHKSFFGKQMSDEIRECIRILKYTYTCKLHWHWVIDLRRSCWLQQTTAPAAFLAWWGSEVYCTFLSGSLWEPKWILGLVTYVLMNLFFIISVIL